MYIYLAIKKEDIGLSQQKTTILKAFECLQDAKLFIDYQAGHDFEENCQRMDNPEDEELVQYRLKYQPYVVGINYEILKLKLDRAMAVEEL